MASAFDAIKRTANQFQQHIQNQLQIGVEAEKVSREQQFQNQFRLDDSEVPLNEIPCELSLPNSSAADGFWTGRLYLSSSVWPGRIFYLKTVLDFS